MAYMSFEVAQEKFSGPLGLLLELIENKKLPITEVSLAKVADEYLNFLEVNEVEVNELADFLLIASRLIYLKSRALIPSVREAEEDLGLDVLEEQLRVYKEFIEAAGFLQLRFGTSMMFVRLETKHVPKVGSFLPPKTLSKNLLAETYLGVLKRLEPFFNLREENIGRIKSVEERIEELRGTLASRASVTFREVVSGAGSKIEVVVSFLALLEMLRQQSIKVIQRQAFGDIELSRKE